MTSVMEGASQKPVFTKILDQCDQYYATGNQNSSGDLGKAMRIYHLWPHSCLSDNLLIKEKITLRKTIFFTHQEQQEVFSLSGSSLTTVLVIKKMQKISLVCPVLSTS